MEFDLFKLHVKKEDKSPRGWIRFGGAKLIKEVKKILVDISNKEFSLLQMAKNIGNELGISYYTVYNYLRQIKSGKWYHNRNENYIPIPILDSLIRLWNSEKYEEEKWKLIVLTDYLITGAPRSKPVKALHKLIPELAKIAGAHAADGTLATAETGKNSHMYRWAVSDGNKSSIEILQKWVNTSFGILVEVKKSKYDNSFQFIVNYKVIFRYLNKILGFKIGNKTHSVKMPKVIKNSTKEMKKCFVLGVLTFDGSVDLDGKLRLNVKSTSLIKDVAHTMKEDGIKLTFPKRVDKLRGPSFKCKITEHGEKILDYLAVNSISWIKAKGFLFGFDRTTVFELFKRTPISKITLSEFFKAGQTLGTFDNQIMIKNLNLSSRTIRKYKNILKLSGNLK